MMCKLTHWCHHRAVAALQPLITAEVETHAASAAARGDSGGAYG